MTLPLKTTSATLLRSSDRSRGDDPTEATDLADEANHGREATVLLPPSSGNTKEGGTRTLDDGGGGSRKNGDEGRSRPSLEATLSRTREAEEEPPRPDGEGPPRPNPGASLRRPRLLNKKKAKAKNAKNLKRGLRRNLEKRRHSRNTNANTNDLKNTKKKKNTATLKGLARKNDPSEEGHRRQSLGTDGGPRTNKSGDVRLGLRPRR